MKISVRLTFARSLRFLSGIAAVSLLTACSAEPQDTFADNVLESGKLAPGTGEDSPITQREQALLDWLRATLPTPSHADVYQAAVEQARGRALYCDTETCSSRFLISRQTRLDFAEGKATRLRWLPFTSGHFSPTNTDQTGIVRIIPLIDRKAMLVIALNYRGNKACAFDGVMTMEDDNTWTVMSLDQNMPTMILTPVDQETFDLSPAQPQENSTNSDYCIENTKISGRYTINKNATAD